MHPAVFAAFDGICRRHVPHGARVLEVGAVAAADTLLALPALAGAALRVGVNIAPLAPVPGMALLRVAPDGLAAFADGCFDAVLCNSVLEHDPAFWRTARGMWRMLRPGGLLAIGVPGYADLPPSPLLRLARRIARWPGGAAVLERLAPGWEAATPTLVVHDCPGDYYRFSVQAMRDVLLDGCTDVRVEAVLRPPRIIGTGFRSGPQAH